MPAVDVHGPVGQAAASICVPTVSKGKMVKTADELVELWKEIVKEHTQVQATGKDITGKEPTRWIKHDLSLEGVDFLLNPAIESMKRGEVVTAKSKKPTPSETCAAMKVSLYTTVFATVYCPAWLHYWLQAVAAMIISESRHCGVLFLHAVKGGPQCDCEVLFVLALLERLGFHQDSLSTDCGAVRWQYTLKRPGKHDYGVWLYQHVDAEKISCEMLGKCLVPIEDLCQMPRLNRMAVISSPVTVLGSGERVDELLNKALVNTMDQVTEKAHELNAFFLQKKDAWNAFLEQLKKQDSDRQQKT